MKGSSRNEALSMATVLALIGAVALVCPFSVLRFKAAPDSPAPAVRAAFVTLTEKQELAALAAAKSSWHGDAGGVKRMRIDLATSDLPEEPVRAVIEHRERASDDDPAALEYSPGAFLPSARAVGPRPIAQPPPSPEPRPPAFSREEMLKLTD